MKAGACVCGVSGHASFFSDKFSGASPSVSSSTSRSGSGLVAGSGEGVGTIVGCWSKGEGRDGRLGSSLSESDSSRGQSLWLIFGLFVAEDRKNYSAIKVHK